jgi:hypothetical protein
MDAKIGEADEAPDQQLIEHNVPARLLTPPGN